MILYFKINFKENLLKVIDVERNFTLQLVTNAALWVDTFFLLSGFLVAHSALHQCNKTNHLTTTTKISPSFHLLLNHPRRILHRYLRLTPSIGGVLALSILIEALGSGPLWYQYVGLSKATCHKYWYGLFLYVNNFWNMNQPNKPPTEVRIL